MILYPNEGCVFLMGEIRTALANCTLHLAKSAINITPATVPADFDEADFGGYAAKTITALLPVYIDPAGGASANIATQQFQASGVAPANIIYAWWVEDATNNLVLAGTFEAPIPMSVATDAIPMDVKFNFGAGQAA